MAKDIAYIIVENGFYFVAYKEPMKLPYVTVSSKGVANGLSEEFNDGWDFGPDSYNPSSTEKIPYTSTVGIQEAVNYANPGSDATISGAVIVSAVVDVETVRPDVFDVTAATVLNGIV